MYRETSKTSVMTSVWAGPLRCRYSREKSDNPVFFLRPNPQPPPSKLCLTPARASLSILRNVPSRVAKLGDLWKPLLQAKGRFNLGAFV